MLPSVSFENESGKTAHVKLDYEWKPSKCSHCGLQWHNEIDCNKNKGEGRIAEKPQQDHTKKFDEEGFHMVVRKHKTHQQKKDQPPLKPVQIPQHNEVGNTQPVSQPKPCIDRDLIRIIATTAWLSAKKQCRQNLHQQTCRTAVRMVLSIKLDEWTDDQVNSLADMGGNITANKKFEFCLPSGKKKPRPDSCIEERSDFIRRKYEMQQFMSSDEKLSCPFPRPTSSSYQSQSCKHLTLAVDKKQIDKQASSSLRISGIGHAFRNSWKRKDDSRGLKKGDTAPGMIEFVGLIKVNVVKGTNLAIRDMVSSDPYVILSLGQQSVKTRVIRNNLNPVWNEKLMLSIPDCIPPLKLLVYDKDTFTTDDFMGQAEIDIQPLVSAARAYERSNLGETGQLGKWVASKDNTLVRDSLITVIDGKVKQEMAIKLQNVERGVLDLELECVPLTQ